METNGIDAGNELTGSNKVKTCQEFGCSLKQLPDRQSTQGFQMPGP